MESFDLGRWSGFADRGLVLLRSTGLGYPHQPDHGRLHVSDCRMVGAGHTETPMAQVPDDAAGDMVGC